ncbi:hypothetical protein CLF_109321 [Clonorchis sinensis]|uniref:Uncharacterized protein n=1 Tax=Clonorchis sinensis TaxID=79923 RepID=G7YSH0_CLOSI|nr:hypothetical protein CLF_109321 [Clonorchis sinensis]
MDCESMFDLVAIGVSKCRNNMTKPLNRKENDNVLNSECLSQGRNTFKTKESDAAQKAPAVRSRIRNETVISYSLRPRVRPTFCSRADHRLRQVNQHCTGSEHVDEAWQMVEGAMLEAFSAVCLTYSIRLQNHWMSSGSLSMIDARKAIPADNEYNDARTSRKRQIGGSVAFLICPPRSAVGIPDRLTIYTDTAHFGDH